MDQPPITKPPTAKIESKERLIIEWASETIPSEKHPERNEDTLLMSPEHRAFGVFDGMGGLSKGEVASQTARDYVIAHLSEIPDGTSVEIAKAALLQIIAEASEAVYNASAYHDMGTTAVVLKIHTDAEGKNYALIANMGDSRIYKIGQDGTLIQITTDDDILNDDKDSTSKEEKLKIEQNLANARSKKDLTKIELGLFNNRNIIKKCLGMRDVSPSIDVIVVAKGESFLLTSDGIHDNLTADEIQEAIRESKTIEEIARSLKNKSLAISRKPHEEYMRAKPDDMSAIVVACK